MANEPTLQDETLVGVGSPKVSGAIFVAPKDTTLPTDATTALSNAFSCLGFISDGGVTVSEDAETEEIKEWGGRTVRIIRKVYREKIAFVPIEVNETVAKETYGDDNVTVTTDNSTHTKTLAIVHTGDELPSKVGVVETVPAPNIVTRYVYPNLKLAERGDQTLDGSSVQGRQLTYNAEKDDGGATCYEYTCITLAA